MLKDYTEHYKRAIELAGDALPTAASMQTMLKELSDEEQTTFKIVNAFMQSSASSGMVGDAVKLIKTNPNADFIDKVGGAIGSVLWENPYTKFMIKKPNQQVEQIARLSKFINEIRNGAGISSAISKVLDTHFNFNTTSKWQMYLDLVIPFSAFTLNNIKFWTDQLSRYGWVASVFRDILAPIWNFDEYNNYELNNNRSLQYNILAGNMILPDNTTVKLSLSIMDMVGLLSNPFDELGVRGVSGDGSVPGAQFLSERLCMFKECCRLY
jgi:hypothetical protein